MAIHSQKLRMLRLCEAVLVFCKIRRKFCLPPWMSLHLLGSRLELSAQIKLIEKTDVIWFQNRYHKNKHLQDSKKDTHLTAS